jgi:syringomycin synthetase protein SyrE
MRAGRDGLLDVLLSFEQQDYTVAFGEAQPDAVRQLFSGLARYALGVTVCEFRAGQDLEWVLEGSSACFEPGEVDMLGRRLWHLVQHLADHPNTLLADVPLMPTAELGAVLQGVHQGVVTDHTDAQLDTFVQRFVDQAHQRPHAVALVWDGGQMAYAELHQRAWWLARELALAGAGPNKVVAMALERGPDLVIGLLAVALAGAAFLPLDVDAPLARLEAVLDDSEAVALLLQSEHLGRLGGLHLQPVLVRYDRPLPSGYEPGLLPADPPAVAALSDAAYVLFTSGSTGRPKGVVVEHGTLARRLVWLAKAYQIGVGDCAGQGTQATFDPALIELLLPLVHGARLALPPPGRLAPEQLGAFAIRHGVTFMAFVPSTLSRFLDGVRGRPGLKLRVACSGGEALPPDLAQRYLRETGARLFNVYGPTETAIFATAWACEVGDGRLRLPIGKPIDDTRVYVLDDTLQPMPFGAAGEIYIGGAAVARGYLNRPDLTARAFLPDPFKPGGRMYRTGDRGWWGRGGELHFGGRLDRQVKLRGYRLELGEIEAAALQVPGVWQAAARLVTRDGQPALCLWVAPRPEADADNLVPSVKRVLRTRLPDYMVPAAVVLLPALPESSTGKTAYDQLPPPHWPVGRSGRGPATDLERTLHTLWESALTARPIGVSDHFFDLGGDSLAAMNLLTDLERRLGRRVHLHTLLEHPTIEELALALGGPAADPGLLLPLTSGAGNTPAGEGVLVYMAASGHGDLLRFQTLAQALGPGFRAHMLQPPLDGSATSTPALAQRYAQLLAERGEPGYVLGFSVGGVAALETARLLGTMGAPVLGLVLLDTIYPRRVLGGVVLWRALGWLVRVLHLQDLSVNGRRLGALFSDAGLVGQVMALEAHRPQPFKGRALLVKTTGLARWDRWFFKPWRRLFEGHRLQEEVVQGLHGTLFEAQHVATVAQRLRAWFGAHGEAGP